jgi:hypothetical protein
MADGYPGYNVLEKTHKRLGCWAHARRKFIEAQKVQPKGKVGKADQALSYIQKLYAIERKRQSKHTLAILCRIPRLCFLSKLNFRVEYDSVVVPEYFLTYAVH